MLETMKAIEERHSVRRYLPRRIEEEKVGILTEEIKKINADSGLYFALCLDNDEVFKANRPHYGSFAGCRNFFALYGNKNDDEKVGYYGERLVLLAQSLGLNTCWVALTFEKKKVTISAPEGMRLFDVIALGYGEDMGTAHRSKPLDKLGNIGPDTPEWFINGIKAASLAPTAINQQRFCFEQTSDGRVHAKALPGPCSKTDLGIVKLHFEIGAGTDNFDWAE